MSIRSAMMVILAPLFLAGNLLASSKASAQQTYTYCDILRNLVDLDRLPYLIEGEECDQFSSYDRKSRYDEATGQYLDWAANADSGNYLRYDPLSGEDVMAEMKGPGYINRIWSANPQGKIRFYLDDAQPIELDFNEIFSGKVPRFRRPLVWQRRVVLGGDNPASNCYLPIPYQTSCKVASVRADKNNPIGQYYHIGYTTLPPGTKLPTFRLDLTDEEKAVLAEVCGKLFNCGWDPQPKELLWERKIVDLQPGQTIEMHDVEGPAIVCQLKGRVTTAAERAIGRRVLLQVYWDEETQPSVWAPMGDFFGESFGAYPYASLPLGMDVGNWYSYWRMPFRSSARFVLTSEARRPCLVALDVGFRKVDHLPDNAAYFHAKWRRERQCSTFDYPLLESTGKGRFVGAALFIDNIHGGWWGEGDEKIYVDLEKFPSFFGTGSEDYFGDAWGIRHFVNPYHGCPLPDPVGRHQSCYRWHIIDSVPFRQSLKMTIENYSATEEVRNDYASMAYWYQAKGGTDFFTPAPVQERLPLSSTFLPGAVEAEKLFGSLPLPAGVSIVDDIDLPQELSGGSGLKLAGDVGSSFDLPITVANTGSYSVQLSLDEGVATPTFELLSNGEIFADKVRLTQGRNMLTLRLTAPASGQQKCHLVLDCLLLTPYKNYVRQWMTIGPWDNSDNNGLNQVHHPEKEIDFDKTYQGKTGDVQWKKATAGPDGIVDLLKHMPVKEYAVAYAYFCATAPQDMSTDLLVGSDDGVKIWVNGVLVHTKHLLRAFKLDEDTVPVKLKKGKNSVLLKVDQGGGGWAFSLRFRDPDDLLEYSLEVP